MNIPMPTNPLYKGLIFIGAGALLLMYFLGFFYTIMKTLLLIAGIWLIYEGIMIAGFDKPIKDLYNKIIKKK